ncbi:MAG: hypothetical protein NTU44_10215, partial [Bacteroidetes bacterium]|nr:hypothetical protein [Bacteroidota bacterium]
DNAEMIPVYFIQLDEMGNGLDSLAERITSTEKTGPDTLQLRLNKVKQYFDSIKSLITGKMQKIDLVLYENGLSAFHLGDTLKADKLLNLALQHNPTYAPALYELIRIHLFPPDALLAEKYLDKAIQRIDSATNPYYFDLFLKTEKPVFDNLLSLAGIYTTRGQFPEALDMLSNAGEFLKKYPRVDGKTALTGAYKNIHQNTYDSYLMFASKARTARRWDLARHFYSEALKYQQLHEEFLPLAITQKNNIDKTLDEEEKSFLLKEKETKPLVVKTKKPSRKHWKYMSGKKRLKRHRKMAIPLPPKDTLVTYCLNRSGMLYLHGEYQPALKMADSALMVNKTKKSMPDSVIQRAIARAAKPLILDSVHAAYFTAWKNDIKLATSVLENGKAAQAGNFLQNDADVSETLAELEKRIQERICFNALSDYEAEVYRAMSCFSKGTFLEGKDNLDNARKIITTNPACHIRDTLLQKTEKQYDGSILWQKYWLEARQALSEKNYPAFFNNYTLAYKVFADERLDRKGIIFSSPLVFIDNQKNMELSVWAVAYYLDAEQVSPSWILLNSLKEQGTDAATLKTLLEKAGRQMAGEDNKTGDIHWLLRLKDGGRWYSVAKRSYLRTRKNKN